MSVAFAADKSAGSASAFYAGDKYSKPVAWPGKPGKPKN
jgi:hypothetical protein